MKRLVSLVMFSMMFTVVMFAAEKKTVDSMKKEIEEKIGQVGWTYPGNLKNAKNFFLEDIYYIEESNYESKRIIKNPVATEHNVVQIVDIPGTVDINKLANKSFYTLGKGDVFLTYEGGEQKRLHLWQMVSQTKMKNALIKKNKGYSCNGNLANIVLKYASWSQEGTTKYNAKGTFLGAPQYFDKPYCAYDTVFNILNGDFSMLFVNYDLLSMTEYKLKYIGVIDNSPYLDELRINILKK